MGVFCFPRSGLYTRCFPCVVQAAEISRLQARVAELESALKRERHRADLCQQELHNVCAARAGSPAMQLQPQLQQPSVTAKQQQSHAVTASHEPSKGQSKLQSHTLPQVNGHTCIHLPDSHHQQIPNQCSGLETDTSVQGLGLGHGAGLLGFCECSSAQQQQQQQQQNGASDHHISNDSTTSSSSSSSQLPQCDILRQHLGTANCRSGECSTSQHNTLHAYDDMMHGQGTGSLSCALVDSNNGGCLTNKTIKIGKDGSLTEGTTLTREPLHNSSNQLYSSSTACGDAEGHTVYQSSSTHSNQACNGHVSTANGCCAVGTTDYHVSGSGSSGGSIHANDVLLISRSEYELLLLKDRAMNSVQVGLELAGVCGV